jgi:Telomere resolvase ResT/TelK catalytic domain
MTTEPGGKSKPALLAYIRERWQQELEDVLLPATLEQEAELEAVWERTLRWLQEERGLQGDSLRKPITQIRSLIKTLPLVAENSWTDSRSRKVEHVALHIFNLPEQEWERMNAHAQLTLQERLENQQFLDRSDAIVNQGLLLIQSDDWAELIVGLALATGRRFWELVKTGSFVEKSAYSVWFTGQVKGRGREDEAFEIPTLVRAFLVVEGIQRLRRLIDWTDLEDEYSPKYQRYNQAANKTVVQYFTDLIPLRVTRERLTVHVLRAVFARIATYWYAPPEVADITFMAQIQGHRYILQPDVEPGETAADVKNKQLNYAANANYFDYKIGRRTAEGGWQIVGDQGIHLGLPGVTRLDAFPVAQSPEELPRVQGKQKGKTKKESTSDWAPLTVRRHTRDWFRELSGGVKGSGVRQSEKDDTFLRQLLTQDVVSSQREPSTSPLPPLSLDALGVSEKTRLLFRQVMALSGSTDVLSFLVALAEPEAQRVLESLPSTQPYETMQTDALDTRDPVARQELYRRAVYTLMKYNQEHLPQDRWYLSDRAIQSVAGGRKEFIKLYKEAHAEEIEAHHRELSLHESFNRKPGHPPIQEVVIIPQEASAFPWGRQPAV